MTIGIDLATYATTLTRVATKHDMKPVRSFDAKTRLGAPVYDYLQAFFGSRNLEKVGNGLPAKVFERLSTDETAKTIASFDHEQEGVIHKEMTADPVLYLLHKIRLSVWSWSLEKAGWNETVDAYDGIRSFDLGIDGLSVTLDHTTARGKQGKSEHAAMFLDGVFGFLVHFRGEHVMTIGFSIASGRRLLLQQVQTRSPIGNRWLFRMPANRMEHIVDRLHAAFPAHTVLVVDGASVADKNLAAYQNGCTSAQAIIVDYSQRVLLNPDNDDLPGYISDAEELLEELTGKIARLTADRPRLKSFYGDLGRFRRTRRGFVSNGLRHYAVAA